MILLVKKYKSTKTHAHLKDSVYNVSLITYYIQTQDIVSLSDNRFM